MLQLGRDGKHRSGRRSGCQRWPAAPLVLLLTAGCVTGYDRPAWERVGSTAPQRSAASTPYAAPAKSAAASPGNTAVERQMLPPPGAAARPAPSAVPAKPAPSAAAPLPASGTPAGVPGKMVASKTAGPARPAIDPAWRGIDIITTHQEDTLLDIAVAHGLGFLEVAIANPGVDPWLPGDGTQVVLPQLHLPPDGPRQGVVINLPEQRLYFYQGGKLAHSYPIGIGRDGHATPVGTTTVARKTVNPVWRPTPSARADDPELPAAVQAGPDNPLGSRALYLGWSSYLIHGTNKEYSIGRRGSRGCIRMYEDDVRALYERVPVGTPLTTLDQPVKVGWIGEELYIQASPTIGQVRQWEDGRRFDPVSDPGARDLVRRKAGKEADRIDWAEVDRALAERRGIVTLITNPKLPAAIASAQSAPPPPSAAAPAAATTASGRSAAATSSTVAVRQPAAPVARPTATAAAGRPATTLQPASRPPSAATASSDSSGDDLVKWLRGRLSP